VLKSLLNHIQSWAGHYGQFLNAIRNVRHTRGKKNTATNLCFCCVEKSILFFYVLKSTGALFILVKLCKVLKEIQYRQCEIPEALLYKAMKTLSSVRASKSSLVMLNPWRFPNARYQYRYCLVEAGCLRQIHRRALAQ
jgi:hypothetical protein